MKAILAILTMFSVTTSAAEKSMKMNFKNEDLSKIIEVYSKASGQKFVVDSAVQGKVSIFLPEPVSIEEAFNQLSSALALNSYAISKQGDTMVVKSARNIQRDLIEVSTERPTLKPERMYTWVYSLKNTPADDIMKELRILPSKDGELTMHARNNQLIFTDWASNLNRIADILKEIDKPQDPTVAKFAEEAKKVRDERRQRRADKSETKKAQ